MVRTEATGGRGEHLRNLVESSRRGDGARDGGVLLTNAVRDASPPDDAVGGRRGGGVTVAKRDHGRRAGAVKDRRADVSLGELRRSVQQRDDRGQAPQ